SILDAERSDQSREEILDAASTAAWKGDDLNAAISLAERLVAFRRKSGSASLGDSLQFLGVLYSRAERYPESVKALEESTALFQRSGAAPEKLASSFSTRGIVLENASRYGDALASFDRSLEIYARKGAAAGEEWRRIGRIYYLRLNNYPKAADAFS